MTVLNRDTRGTVHPQPTPIYIYRASARLKESSKRAALTSDQHEKDGKYLLVVRVGGNVAEAHGDEARETKVEGGAVAALKRAVYTGYIHYG